MKLYAVTKGAYSSYRIITLTTSKERAERLASLYSGEYDESWVEEYEEEDVNDTRIPYKVYFYKSSSALVFQEEFDDFKKAKRNKIDDHTKKYTSHDYIVYVLAQSEEQALKIASDRLAQWKAEKEVI